MPLETALTQFLQRSARTARETADLRQKIYLRVRGGAKQHIPLRRGRLFSLRRAVF